MSPLHSLFTSKTRQAKETKNRQTETERNWALRASHKMGLGFLLEMLGGGSILKKKHYVLIIEILCLNNSI